MHHMRKAATSPRDRVPFVPQSHVEKVVHEMQSAICSKKPVTHGMPDVLPRAAGTEALPALRSRVHGMVQVQDVVRRLFSRAPSVMSYF